MTLPRQDDPQFKLRVPRALLMTVAASANANNRSTNAEIVHRLETHQNPETEPTDMAKGSALTVRLSDETKATLDRLSQRGPYRISMTSIVERGIELAAQELESVTSTDDQRPLKVDTNTLAEWCDEASRYFEGRPTGGEDTANWSNVQNAETARKCALALRGVSP